MSKSDKFFAIGAGIILLLLLWVQPALAPGPGGLAERGQISPPRTIRLIAAGDVLLSRGVALQIEKNNNPHLPFAGLVDLLKGADLVFANLECPLTNLPVTREGLVFNCPASYAKVLAEAGFDVVSLANNHAMDQGPNGLFFTKQQLHAAGLLGVGTGQNLSEAWRPAVTEIDDTKIGFLAASYASFNDGGRGRNDYVARTDDLANLQTALASLRPQSDIIIVSMHAGYEYTRLPNPEQTAFARAAIEGGADVVIGHHPHWIQNVEIYQNKPIFYSLGNFIFDQMWSQETREGLVLRLTIDDKRLQTAELLPVIIDNFCCPRLATGEDQTAILQKIKTEPVLLW